MKTLSRYLISLTVAALTASALVIPSTASATSSNIYNVYMWTHQMGPGRYNVNVQFTANGTPPGPEVTLYTGAHQLYSNQSKAYPHNVWMITTPTTTYVRPGQTVRYIITTATNWVKYMATGLAVVH